MMNNPPPLTARITGSFAYLTVKDRLPVILTNIIDDLCRRKYDIIATYGKHCIDELKIVIGKISELKSEMQTNKALSNINISRNPCNDDKYWNVYFKNYRETYQEEPKWYCASWLSVECYMYRKIGDIFQSCIHLSSFDPFIHLKKKTMIDYNTFIQLLLKYTNGITSSDENNSNIENIQNKILTYTQISLWGNQCDLSISTTVSLTGEQSIYDVINAKKSNILVWDFNSFWNFLLTRRHKYTELGLVLDNAGIELISDLCLMTVLMKYDFISKVTFYPKIRPYFVSDTTTKDIGYVIEYIKGLSTEGLVLGNLWDHYFKESTWIIKEDPFWTGPQDYSELKEFHPELYNELALNSLVIFKGDLNYRKLTGDLDWPNDTDFKTSLRGFLPSNILVLRTIKGGPVTGLNETNPFVVAAKCKDNWYFSGDYGMVHFVEN